MAPVPTHADPELVLTLWARALGLAGGARADMLLQAVDEGASARTLGERNAALMTLHARLFGPEAALLSACPACGTVAQFSADCTALAAQISRPDGDPGALHRLEAEGYVVEFRLPDRTDIDAASVAETEDGFASHLLARCVLACVRNGVAVAAGDIPLPVLDALSQRMECLDPGASVSFALQCPQCATGWQALLDVEQLVWRKLQAAAEQLVVEVDALARAYGWSEPEVLRLGPTRRAAYLQMVAA